ncbi:hypothetical protein EDD11_008431 [Mortierella claussenii]|nr:hypothetical protein EDD11_008431 [Mortierella claussenii]
MAWKQTCIKNIFTGNMNCAKWGISNSKISGMTQISHTAQIAVKTKNQGKQQNNQISSNHHHQQQRNAHLANANAPALRDDLPDPSDLNATQPLLTLTNINVTTPSFNLMTPIALMGFSVPGVFDMGASVGLGGAVKLAILVQASQDLVMNTGSATSCPWIIDWNGSFLDIPTIQFGTCSMPDSIKAETVMPNGDIGAKSRQTAAVSVGMTVSPSFSLGLKVFGITALSAGISSPISLGLDTLWDTDKTQQCPANNVAVSTEGSAGLQLVGGFFGFSKSIPVLQSPTLQTPSICIPHS